MSQDQLAKFPEVDKEKQKKTPFNGSNISKKVTRIKELKDYVIKPDTFLQLTENEDKDADKNEDKNKDVDKNKDKNEDKNEDVDKNEDKNKDMDKNEDKDKNDNKDAGKDGDEDGDEDEEETEGDLLNIDVPSNIYIYNVSMKIPRALSWYHTQWNIECFSSSDVIIYYGDDIQSEWRLIRKKPITTSSQHPSIPIVLPNGYLVRAIRHGILGIHDTPNELEFQAYDDTSTEGYYRVDNRALRILEEHGIYSSKFTAEQHPEHPNKKRRLIQSADDGVFLRAWIILIVMSEGF